MAIAQNRQTLWLMYTEKQTYYFVLENWCIPRPALEFLWQCPYRSSDWVYQRRAVCFTANSITSATTRERKSPFDRINVVSRKFHLNSVSKRCFVSLQGRDAILMLSNDQKPWDSTIGVYIKTKNKFAHKNKYISQTSRWSTDLSDVFYRTCFTAENTYF